MKVSDAKQLVENIIYTKKENRFTEEQIKEKFPELIHLSKVKNKNGLHLYRVIKLLDENKIKEMNIESTSKDLLNCAEIAYAMPSNVDFEKLKTIYLSFDVPKENILLDINLILPILENKLSKVLNHKIYDKNDEPITLRKAFELIKENDENEVIADLTNISYQKAVYNGSDYSFLLNMKNIRDGLSKCMYPEDIKEQLKIISPILSKEDKKTLEYWKNKVFYKNKNTLTN